MKVFTTKTFRIAILFLLTLNVSCTTVSSDQHDFNDTFTSVYWDVKDKKGNDHLLLGTLHIIASFESLPKSIQTKLNESDVVVTEIIDIDNQLLGRSLFSKNPKNIEEYLGKNYLDKLEEIFRKSNSPLKRKQINQLSYFGVYSTLISMSAKQSPSEKSKPAHSKQDISKNSTIPMDFYIMKLAKQNGKKQIGLESTIDQVNAFTELCTAEFIKKGIDSFDKMGSEINGIVESYGAVSQEGSSISYGEYMKEIISSMSPEEREILLDKRNQLWIPRLKKIFEESQKGSFIAFGAAHLPGELGIVNLLRQAGYSVTPHKAK